MKKLILFIALFFSPVFAQEEEQDIQIEIETGGSPAVGIAGSALINSVVATPDGSVWYSIGGGIVYCSVDEDGNPHCEEVDVED